MKSFLVFLGTLLGAQAALASNLIVCTKVDPSLQWISLSNGQFNWQGRGPAVIINPQMQRVTWMGTGGYIQLTGERNSAGIKIVRIDGRPGQEKIVSSQTFGQVTDFQLQDSLGGVGLLRVFLGHSGVGRANWQHATDTMKEDFAFCTTNVLN